MDSMFYKNLVEQLPIGYALHKLIVDEKNNPIDYVFVNVNNSFEKYTGLKSDDIIGKSILKVLPSIEEDDFDWISFYGSVTLEGKTANFTQFSTLLQRTYKVHAYSPKSMYFVTLFSDYTIEEKREQVLHNIIRLAPVPMMIHTEDKEVIHISDAFETLSGYSLSEIKTIREWITKAHKQEDIKELHYDKCFNNEKNQYHGEFDITAKDGTTLSWNLYSTYIGVIHDGRRIAMTVALDVTKQNKYNTELERTKILLQSSLNSAKNIIIISLDLEYRYLYFNEAHRDDMKAVYGTDVKIGDCIFDYMTSQEEIDRIKRNYDIALSGVAHKKVEIYGPNHYEIKFNPILDGNDDVIGISVFAEDVTEKYQLEQQVTYQKQIADLYFEVTNQLLIVLNKNAEIVLINNAGCKILEDQKDNILGLNWFSNFIPKNVHKEVQEVFNDVFEKGFNRFTSYTNEIVTSKGNVRVMKWNNTLIKDKNGNITNVLSSGEDITEQTRFEEQLLHLSNTDALTELYNRRYYESKIHEYDVSSCLPLSIIMMDINGLKLVNDAFGHNNGDELLKQTAVLLENTFSDKGFVARIGGDEFAILLPQTSFKNAEKLVSEMSKISSGIQIQGVPLSISSGVETKTDIHQDILQVVRSAEDKMYRMKLLEIPSMRSSTIETILTTLYEKDSYSRSHSQNTANLLRQFGEALGLSISERSELYSTGLLHDIGKIVIPNDVLNKPDRLTEDEYEIVKKHSEIGFRILNSAKNLRDISEIVLYHHEWWNGEGYPEGRQKEDIPYYSRILAIVDSYDAMTTERTYKKTFTSTEALDELKRCSGTQFDPKLVEAFCNNHDKIIK